MEPLFNFHIFSSVIYNLVLSACLIYYKALWVCGKLFYTNVNILGKNSLLVKPS